MIKLEHVVLASPEQMEFIIEGMRNPMNSWEKSDSDSEIKYESWHDMSGGKYEIGPNDHSLMQRLSNAGTDHRKFMRMMPVYVRITAPLYWWKEFDTYKVGTVANSCSTMHKIQAKEFRLEDFSCEHKDWYDKFFEITEDLNIELHTSLPNVAGAPYDAFDRVVYHLHSLEQLYSIKRQNCAIVRVVFVVTENFTEDLINRIAIFCANSDDIDELSFRQMVDNHYQETYYCYKYLKAGHKKLWWYIEQNDYNLYYCQNKVYTEYKNIGR